MPAETPKEKCIKELKILIKKIEDDAVRYVGATWLTPDGSSGDSFVFSDNTSGAKLIAQLTENALECACGQPECKTVRLQRAIIGACSNAVGADLVEAPQAPAGSRLN